MVIISKIIKSNWHQIKPKQNDLTYTPLENIWDLSALRLVNKSTKKSKEVPTSKIRFHFWNQLVLSLLMSLDIIWNPQNLRLYLHRKQHNQVIIRSSIKQNFRAHGTYDHCYKLKRKKKENKNPIICTNIINHIYFVKSRSNSSSKAEKHMFEA